MSVFIIISTSTINYLKKKAKKLKQQKNISHCQALDLVACEYGKKCAELSRKDLLLGRENSGQILFTWKHIIEAHQQVAEAEKASLNGFVVLVDFKENYGDTKHFVRDINLAFFCRDQVKQLYLERTDVDEDGVIPTKESLLQWFDDEYDSFAFYRFKGEISNMKQMYEYYFEDFFFPSEVVVFKGDARDDFANWR